MPKSSFYVEDFSKRVDPNSYVVSADTYFLLKMKSDKTSAAKGKKILGLQNLKRIDW